MSNNRTIQELLDLSLYDVATDTSRERGRKYYDQGRVNNLIFRDDRIQAEVLGSEKYRVTFYHGSATCTCPYDFWGWCKHLVAVYYATINQAEEHNNISGEFGGSSLPGSSEEDVGLVKKHLAGLTRSELEALVVDKRLYDASIYPTILRKIGGEKAQKASDYKREARSIIKHSLSDNGYLINTVPDFSDMYDSIRGFIASKNFEAAKTECLAILDVIEKYLMRYDDSYGLLSSERHKTFSLYQEVLSKIEKNTSFLKNEQKRLIKKMINNECDFFSDEYAEAIYALYSKDSFDDLFPYLKKQREKTLLDTRYYTSFIERSMTLLVTKILLLVDKQQAAENIVIQYGGENTGIVFYYVDFLIDQGSLDHAIDILNSFLEHSNYKHIFLKKMIDLYTHNLQYTQAIQTWLLYIEESKRFDLKTYKRIQKYCKKPNRKDVKRKIFQLLGSHRIIIDLYIEENMIEEARRKVKEIEVNTVYILYEKKYFSLFSPIYTGEVRDLFYQDIDRDLTHAQSRKFYKDVTAKLGLMKTISGYEYQTDEFISLLKKKYANRPAMLDEFRKNGL